MSVNTAKVTDRRKVHYDRPEDILADVEKLAAGPVQTLGNWTFPQIVGHLANVFHLAIDGSGLSVPWYIKLVAPFLKRSFLTKPQPVGFQLPKKAAEKLVPSAELTLKEALANLRDALARYCREPKRANNALFGKLTPDEWDRYLCRHAESHMSFVKPG